jgi:hypothetical protein
LKSVTFVLLGHSNLAVKADALACMQRRIADAFGGDKGQAEVHDQVLKCVTFYVAWVSEIGCQG